MGCSVLVASRAVNESVLRPMRMIVVFASIYFTFITLATHSASKHAAITASTIFTNLLLICISGCKDTTFFLMFNV